MKTFSYTIRDELGLHARPAGLLVNAAKQYQSSITVTKGEKSASCGKLLALMGLGIRCGDTITVTVEGSDEEAAQAGIRAFLESNL